jgi:phospholipid transport system substrate-binding protein
MTPMHSPTARFRPEPGRRRAGLLILSAPVLAAACPWAIALFGASPASAQTAAVSAPPPDQFIEMVSNKALDRIRQDSAIQAGDTQRVLRFVDEEIMPHVNFERMTGLAVGRAWRQASPEQRNELIEQFRLLLVRTYSGALSQAGNKTVRMRPQRGDAAAAEVLVRSELVGGSGEPIQIDYRLERSGASWKIYDVNVLGIWIVQTYRDQFAAEASAKGVDGLIASLKARNQQAAAASANR